MKVTDIYDKHLLAIEEAERKVCVAKPRLHEAEVELDTALCLAENLFNDTGDKREYIIEVLNDNGNWVHVGQKMEKGKVVYSFAKDSAPKVFPGENSAKGALWDQLIADGYREGVNLRICDRNKD